MLIVEEQLELANTDMAGLRAIAARLPFEPCMSILATLAGRVETTISRPEEQVPLAEAFFGPSELVRRYQSAVKNDPKAAIFGPQSLYILMRTLIEEARDAPITEELTVSERMDLMRAVVASNSVIERGTDPEVGPTSEDLLAYELQIGNYYSRPPWLEEMTRARELYRLATEDEELLRSPDCLPVADWIGRDGLTAKEGSSTIRVGSV